MLTTAKVCALLLGGAAVGYTAPIAVKKVSPKPVAAKVKQPGVSTASRPRVVRPEPAARPAANILDCPTTGLGGFSTEPNKIGGIEDVSGLSARPAGSGHYRFDPPVGDGIFVPTGGPVPEPDTWVMLIAGFGLVGASMRRRKGEDRAEISRS